ncbi:MAG: hypothetical protein GQ557_00035 [Mycoplasmataceae bacterium]|nr:hypothetical protein [Mycoplasmataceae bacterium]
MTKINIIALGGLDEKTKGMYILDIDSKIYIFDAGVYEPLNDEFGIQHYIPNITYLEQNRDKIKGIFLSSANILKIGAISQIVKLVPKIAIFGSQSTIDSLPIFFGEKTNSWNTKVLSPNQAINLGNKVKPIPLTGAIPGTFGYSIETPDGNIVYMVDYIFDTIDEYKNDPISEHEALTNGRNLVFLSDSLNSGILSSISPKFRITEKISGIINEPKRILVAIYEDEIINVIETINLAIGAKKQVFFTDKRLFNLILMLMKRGEILTYSIKMFDGYKKDKATSSIIIISGTRTNLYQKILVYIEETNNIKFKIEKTDIFVLAAPPQAGNEHVYANITNNIFRINPELIKFSVDEKLSIHPSQFDIKNYIKLIKPLYFMPIQGYYKELIKAKNVALMAGIPSENILIIDNGEVLELNNRKNNGVVRKIKDVGSTIIEEVTDSGIATEVVENRMALAKDGLCTIGMIYDPKTLKPISNFDIQMRGVIFVNNQDQLMSRIEELVLLILERNKSDFKLNKVESQIRKELAKLLRAQIKKVPMIVLKIQPYQI